MCARCAAFFLAHPAAVKTNAQRKRGECSHSRQGHAKCAPRAGRPQREAESGGPPCAGPSRSECRSQRAAAVRKTGSPRHLQARPGPIRERVANPKSHSLLRQLSLRQQLFRRRPPLRRRRWIKRRLHLLTTIKRSSRCPHRPPLAQILPKTRKPMSTTSAAFSRALTPPNSRPNFGVTRKGPMHSRSPCPTRPCQPTPPLTSSRSSKGRMASSQRRRELE